MTLLGVGLSLDDLVEGRLSWQDAYAVILQGVRTVGSPLDRALRPEAFVWNPQLVMLRTIEYNQRRLEFVVASALGATPDEPEPLPMIGIQAADETGEPVSTDVADAWLAKRRGGVITAEAVDISEMAAKLKRSAVEGAD